MRQLISGALSSVANWIGPAKPPTKSSSGGPRIVRARYDAAQVDNFNERHFALSDGLSARQANSPGVRERLRNYARYEVANNCYARGVANTLADVEIGRGAKVNLPRMIEASRQQRQAAKTVERMFNEWAEEIDLWGKLWTMRVAKLQDGEAVAVFRNNPRLEGLVELDLQLIEAEQLSHGHLHNPLDPNEVDGVLVDDNGNVLEYYVLREHPGDGYQYEWDPITVAPQQVVHWFRVDRPGQLRGIPEITPALPLFAHLRRFTLATVTAAESAADVAGVITSNITPDYDPEDDDEVRDNMNLLDIHRGMWMELPDGRQISQLKAEHPTTTYDGFKRELLGEIGRCLNMPKAIVLADASDYNYASGRLDRQAFDRHIETAQRQCERHVLRKIWRAWWYEASRIEGYLPRGARAYEGMQPRWLWRVLGHVDRQKEESGRAQALENNTTTLAEECGRDGLWWEDVLEQRAFERERIAETMPQQITDNMPTDSADSDELDRSEIDKNA